MKIANTIIALVALYSLANLSAYSETIHQTAAGKDAYVAGGGAGSALTKGVIEVKDVADGTAARVKGSVGQWDYVTYWFGIPAPAGKAIVRFKVYVDGGDTANFAIYTQSKGGQKFVTHLQVPADAKKDSFVNVDVPVDVPEEWSGVTLKKFEKSDKPSPWIESVSIVLP